MHLGADAASIGRVLRTHGLDGAVVVEVDDDDARDLLQAPRVLLDAEPGTIPYRIESVRPFAVIQGRARVWIRFVGLDDPEHARRWVGARVLLEASHRRALGADEHSARDLIGLRCRSADGRTLGVVREIWPTADVDQILIEGERGPFFVPARESVLVRVSPGEGEIVVDLEQLGFDPREEIG